MRRSSNAVLQSQTSEPLIVVEDSYYEDPEEQKASDPDSHHSSEDESPTMNPYLLSPYSRDVRKHSLPTPQCSGITASQVRRLSERGETVGPGPRQAEFLATLSTAPAPSPGGRRHSVVTISKVPPTLFGRNRRESVAAFSSGTGFPTRVLPNRRESIACPPSTEPRGSVHNLQLDIMDDIVQARKVRMKLWTTSNERVCEVQPLDDSKAGDVQRYTNSSNRRYSDFVGTTLAPIPSSSKRRASELPPPNTCTTTSASKPPTIGIVCSNTDLISILSSLSTSSTEINQCETARKPEPSSSKAIDQKRSRLKSNRSSSFDISILHSDSENTPSNWFAKRHQPISNRVVEKEPGKVVWDERSGSLVDAQALGSAIEGFLRQTTPETGSTTSPHTSPSKCKTPTNKSAAGRAKTSWFSSKGESDSTETCDSSLCSTLKDLFVK
ncbi:uncharacterized protein kairos [Tribolium castaneum]|uniref:uncharacterized protein kairos n=1 Tax=Tribolium castaneum TaxID=7070 RepID=UPI0000D554CD|nr:PREDICTED: uncharacterized protein LOC655989 [Tribolium castaneum]|eukprot:XP_008200820.1 PREDICTED: uncharacterized protein LOC655989 [Tribolium castaneum]